MHLQKGPWGTATCIDTGKNGTTGKVTVPLGAFALTFRTAREVACCGLPAIVAREAFLAEHADRLLSFHLFYAAGERGDSEGV